MPASNILNGGHQVLCFPGALLGIGIMSDTMADPRIRRFFRKVEEEEIVPHVKPVPGFTAPAYLESIDKRFSNRAIVDTTRRVAFDGTSRQPGFILPSVRDGLATGRPVEGLALVSALWCRYCLGTREDGSTVEPNDPMWDELHERAKAAADVPAKWLEMTSIYGDSGKVPRFSDAFVRWRTMLETDGTAAALAAYCG